MAGNKFKDVPMCCGTPLQDDRCVHCHDYYGDNDEKLVKKEEKKTCRIYCDLLNQWTMLWHIKGRGYPLHEKGRDKEDLIQLARSKKFTHYFDEYTDNLVPL